MKIRKAKGSDIKEILKLAIENNEFHRGFSNIPLETPSNLRRAEGKQIRKDFKSRNVSFFVAEECGKIIGHMTAEIHKKHPFTKPKTKGYIADTYILKKHRKKGLTRLLFAEVLKWFKKRRVTHISLAVNTQNKTAVKVWHRLGFKDTILNMNRGIK